MTSRVCAMGFLVVLAFAALAKAQTFTVLYNFSGGSDGAWPDAGLTQDPGGNLYGTTWAGGRDDPRCGFGCGVVFKVDPSGNETVVHSFAVSGGKFPYAPVIRDRKGNTYGTANQGGADCPGYGCGTVFKIDTDGKETVLHKFTGGSDGCFPNQGLVRDEAGNLYGTASECGSPLWWGTIFEVDGAGKFTVLHVFTGETSDGGHPAYGHLTMDESGNLYGLTNDGGAFGQGVLYEMGKNGTFAVLHSFPDGATDGCHPEGTAVRDGAGNVYGTTDYCKSNNNYGTIWKVSKKGKETILHTFSDSSSDGCYPAGGVFRDSKDNLYGVTVECGANNYGTLYELSANGTFTLLHSFDKSDGGNPVGEVLRTAKGILFGTAYLGGSGDCNGNGCGTVWKYVP